MLDPPLNFYYNKEANILLPSGLGDVGKKMYPNYSIYGI